MWNIYWIQFAVHALWSTDSLFAEIKRLCAPLDFEIITHQAR